MLHVELFPQGVRESAHLPRIALTHVHLLQPVVLDHHCQLAVPIAQHRPVIDVGRSNQGYSVINNQELAVYVNDFGDWAIGQFSMCTQAEEEEVVIQIGHFPQLMVDIVDVL